MNIGILGCGNISSTYIQEIQRIYPKLLQIEAVADRTVSRAKETAVRYQIPRALSIDELLEDPTICLIVNLTAPKAHKELNLKILNAGKHVFCEKPFALTVEDAQEVAAVAEEKGLYIGAAPDTFLTAPMQDCRRLLEDGWIGKPLYVTANMISHGMETWHPSPKAFYEEGGGPLYDMAGYYLSVLIHLFGPVEEVFSYSGKAFEERRIYSQPLADTRLKVEVPTHYTSVLRMKNGVLVNMNMSFDIWYSTLPKLEVYGTEGTMTMPDPNRSEGLPKIFRKEQVLAESFGMTSDMKSYEVPLRSQTVSDYTRGTGVAELACAIKEGRKNRAGVQMAIHMLEVIQGIMKSSENGERYVMQTECVQPTAWDWRKALDNTEA
ncbi:MAG: Gfo/Idh/MocA family oxidoreductase [Eubacteriales bacterium]|nr:Gfo/Idh/MocA family oxidoreductase [Eubacteriales bacterium]